MKFHVHIYKVISKAEIDVEAGNDEEARKMVLYKKRELVFKESDCEFITMAFPHEDGPAL